MSRSGYGDYDGDCIPSGLWQNAVHRAITGKRGQQFFRDLADAMDAIPKKELIANRLETAGAFCTLGVIGTLGENKKPSAPQAMTEPAAISNGAMWKAKKILRDLAVSSAISLREAKAIHTLLAAQADADAQPSTVSAVKSAAHVIFKAAIASPHTVDSNSVTLHLLRSKGAADQAKADGFFLETLGRISSIGS